MSTAFLALPPTAAERSAEAQFTCNLVALTRTQPEVVDALQYRHSPVAEWVYGRDGALTARDPRGVWVSGSVPKRLAKVLLAGLEVRGHACFLSPEHAEEVRLALAMLRREQALYVVLPDPEAAWVMLHCSDFSEAIRQHRLWLAVGEDWERMLATLLRERDGLPLPGQFIKTKTLAESEAQGLIDRSQGIFNEETRRRQAMLSTLVRRPESRRGTVGLVRPSSFRLWDRAADVLFEVLKRGDQPVVTLDPDDPVHASPLALARWAAGCDAVVAADRTRGDFGGAVARETPIVTWVTGGRVPSFAECGPGDRLIVCDPRWEREASGKGWPAGAVAVATWPDAQASAGSGEQVIGVIAETAVVSPDGGEFESSSHRVLWEMIYAEIAKDPSSVGVDPPGYLSRRMKNLSIPQTGVDRPRFLRELVLPHYQQSVVRCLAKAGIPVLVWGRGWLETDLRTHHAGVVGSEEEFGEALRSCKALAHVWPTDAAHPIDAAGKSVLRTAGKSAAQVIAEARACLDGGVFQTRTGPVLTARLLTDWLRGA